jgi:hypothetical protein
MSAPATRRLALAAATAAVGCALAAAPAAALPGPVPAGIGPAPAVGEVRAEEDLVPVSRVVPDAPAAVLDGGRAPLVATGAGVVVLMGAFVVGLSRRPEPVD